MQDLTPQQVKKIEKLDKLAKILEKGDVGIFEHLVELESTVDESVEALEAKVAEAVDEVKEIADTVGSNIPALIEEALASIPPPEDGHTPSAEELTAIILPLVLENMPDVKDGESPSRESILEMILENMPEAKDGIDADEKKIIEAVGDKLESELPQFGTAFRDGLEILDGDERLDRSAVKGLDDYEEVSKMARQSKSFTGITGIKEIIAGTNVTVDNSNLGYPVVSSTGGGGGGAFTDLTDVPASYTGQALKVVSVNAGENALVFTTLAGGGDALTANPLSQFAATTSLQLKNTISDETGSGALVFANTPTLVTPVLGAATATSINGATITSGTLNGSVTGTNTGDQTSIVGITGTKAQFDTAVTDGNILYVGDVTQYTDEMAQDATGAMAANSTFVSLAYNDATPSLTPSLSASGTPSSSTFLRGDNTWATPSGSGTVTATGGSLTANSVVLGAGTTDTKVVAGVTTDGTSQLNLGVNATTLGAVKMFGSTSGDVTVKPAAVAGTATVFQLPATNGTNGHYLQTNGSGVTSWQAASGSAFTPVVNNYTASTTMSDPGAGCTLIRVRGIGGGAGGGSGRKHTSASGRAGGSGGSAGAYIDVQFPYSSVSSWPVTITIGAGGAGGAAVTSNSTAGNNGTAGGDTSFGAIVVLKGGDGGTGGSSATSRGGDARFGANNSVSTVATNAAPAAGGQAGATAAVTTAGANGFAGAGGAGGGLTTGNATMSGTSGGSNAKGTAAVAGGTAGNAGGAGTAGDTTAPYIFFGGNGGSGGGSSTTAGLAGGAGGLYGAGGGGGTAGTDSVNDSGAGGAGADGFMQVIAT